MKSIILIANNLRSIHNVGSIIRTADGFGVDQVYLTGYSPYPLQNDDTRLPHLAKKIDTQINKTALGAEKSLGKHANSIQDLILKLKTDGYVIVAIEQNTKSIKLPKYKSPQKIALVLGNEIEGVENNIINLCDEILEIDMHGKKESFNVVQAAAIVLYHIKYF